MLQRLVALNLAVAKMHTVGTVVTVLPSLSHPLIALNTALLMYTMVRTRNVGISEMEFKTDPVKDQIRILSKAPVLIDPFLRIGFYT